MDNINIKTALILIDHGSKRQEANQLLEELVKRIQIKIPDRLVLAAHMELASPSIEDAIDMCIEKGIESINFQPFMLAYGRHVHHDIPTMIQEKLKDVTQIQYQMKAPLGTFDEIMDLIIQIETS